jgi:eukaryotic-like serine/threonine-protein kinase
LTPACLDDAELLEVGEGRRELSPPMHAHLATCAACRMVLAAAARGRAGTLRDAAEEAASGDEPSWDELGAGVVVDGRYVLERFLGAGGMGVVWAARRASDGARFALKTARGTDAELSRRLVREARVLAALEHPSIVRAIEVLPATATRGATLVLPLLEGETLDARLRRVSALSLADAARVVRPVAEALAAAHAHGIVHRDVKPQNVFLAGADVFVLDFGIAKLTPEWGPHSKLTGTGASIGTPRYMAPEQIFGEAAIDARADVWALGALLFQTLAGRPLLRATSFGDLVKELTAGELDDLGSLVPGLPPDVLDIIRHALIIPRDARTMTAARIAAILTSYG